MHWGAYEVFSVLSGIALIIMAVVPGQKPSERAWALVGGGFFLGYGIYVANQDSGTWTFPVWIFVIPFAAVIYLIASIPGRKRAAAQRDERPGGQP